MTNKKYRKIMLSLSEDLQRAASTKPYNPDEYDKVTEAMNRTNRARFLRRRKFSCWTRWIIWFLLGVLSWIVWTVVF